MSNVHKIDHPVKGWVSKQGFQQLSEEIQTKLLDPVFGAEMSVVYQYLHVDTAELIEYKKQVCITLIIYIFQQKTHILK